MTRSVMAVACAWLVACGPTEEAVSGSEIMEADRAFAQATAENGVEGWVSYFAEEGIMVSGQMVVMGHDSIRALMTPAFSDSTYSLQWEPTRADIAVSGDLGYTLGKYERRRTDPDGMEETQTGSYLSVWRRQDGGEWKVVLDIGSPDDTRN